MFYNLAQKIEQLRRDTDRMNLDDKAKDHVYWCLEQIGCSIKMCEREISEQRTINVHPSYPACGWPS